MMLWNMIGAVGALVFGWMIAKLLRAKIYQLKAGAQKKSAEARLLNAQAKKLEIENESLECEGAE